MAETLRLGYHISTSGSMDLAFNRASEMNCSAMQVFVSNPRGWQMRPVSDTEIRNFREAYKKHDIAPVVAHMPYLPNLGSAEEAFRSKTMVSLNQTIARCAELGIPYLVTHLGSHKGKGSVEGVRNVVDAINQARLNNKVMLLLENTAGHANSIGSRLEEMADIRDGVSGKVGFCLDTCHLFAAGYDIRREEVIESIDKILDLKNVHLFHLNDSKFEFDTRHDRHENIGKGYIGIEGFRRFFNFDSIREKPFILETPEGSLAEIALVRNIAAQ